MEPRIQYARTSDGVSIAYAVMGNGPPFVMVHGGETLISGVVRQLVAGKGFLFNDRGEHALKGFGEPVRVFEVQWVG